MSMKKTMTLKDLDQKQINELQNLWESIAGKNNDVRPSLNPDRQTPEDKEFLKRKQNIDTNYKLEKARIVNNYEENYFADNLKQQRITSVISRISPVSVYVYLITNLCNTGLNFKEKFWTNIGNFYNELSEQIFDKYEVSYIRRGGSARFTGDIDAPPPSYRPVNIKVKDLHECLWIDLTLLILFNILTFALCYTVFLKYDVR